MWLTELRAANWRNLRDVLIGFSPEVRLNVLFGENAQGKTNILEAIYFLSAFRSFRTSQSSDLVRQGFERASVAGKIVTQDLVREVEVSLGGIRGGPEVSLPASSQGSQARVEKRISIDGKACRSTAQAFGVLSVVLFVPEDLSLFRASPSLRRRFLDLAISGVERSYFAAATDFQKVLRSRNALLKNARGAAVPSTLLDTYDEEFARTGAEIVHRRREQIAGLAPQVQTLFSALHASLDVSMTYESDPGVQAAGDLAAIRKALLAGLAAQRKMDLRRGHTTFGPQLDDFEVRLNGRPAREHASQGQLRSLVLSLKLAELANIQIRTHETPLLLLDDVPSELDLRRRQYMFETLDDLECQTILSVADRSVISGGRNREDFAVSDGRVERVPS